MKTLKYTIFALAGAALLASSCIDEVQPAGGTLIKDQVNETVSANPVRVDAPFLGMYSNLGSISATNQGDRPDNFSFIMMAFSNDLEAADIVMPDSGYNWFSVCGELTSRNADYANPYIRYMAAYTLIGSCNDLLVQLPEETDNKDLLYQRAQVKAVRAFAYLNLAPYYQFSYDVAADQPCVPIVTEKTIDTANNPRASVSDVYGLIIDDLTYAIDNLEGFVRPDKGKIDRQAALALRARAYLYMGKYPEAAEDAEKASEGYTPATMEEVSHPSFYSVNEHNWIWGYAMTEQVAAKSLYSTSSSWIRSFSGKGYSAATACYASCNNIFYNKVPASDVRKGWWVNDKLESPLLDGLKWNEYEGQAIAKAQIPDVKEPFTALTNVKFGCKTVGTVLNDEDWPFIRVEEMILTRAEALYKSGKQEEGKKVLQDFVKTYRDPSYNVNATTRSFEDEVWFQRRLELWGEGFSNADTRRLNKPLVRFTNPDTSNVPTAFMFNMTADDGWWLLRFTKTEKNNNAGIVDNVDGTIPVSGQHPELRDGVTD